MRLPISYTALATLWSPGSAGAYPSCRGPRGSRQSGEVSSLSQTLYMQFFFKYFFCFLRLVHNLTNNIDVENTKVRLEQYQRDNRDIIQRNKAKLVSKVSFTLTLCSLRLFFLCWAPLFLIWSVIPARCRHENKRSWRSCCCWSSKATSSGGWRCCRRSRGNFRPRGRTSRHS